MLRIQALVVFDAPTIYSAAAPAAARPRLVVPGETTDSSNHRGNSSVEDRDAACDLGRRQRWW